MPTENKPAELFPSLATGSALDASTWTDFVERLSYDCNGAGVKWHHTAALLLAEIERVDRVGLIKHWPVKRDENGMFWHPDLPSFDEGDGDKCEKWLAEQSLVVKMSSIEDAPDEISERYFDS